MDCYASVVRVYKALKPAFEAYFKKVIVFHHRQKRLVTRRHRRAIPTRLEGEAYAVKPRVLAALMSLPSPKI